MLAEGVIRRWVDALVLSLTLLIISKKVEETKDSQQRQNFGVRSRT